MTVSHDVTEVFADTYLEHPDLRSKAFSFMCDLGYAIVCVREPGVSFDEANLAIAADLGRIVRATIEGERPKGIDFTGRLGTDMATRPYTRPIGPSRSVDVAALLDAYAMCPHGQASRAMALLIDLATAYVLAEGLAVYPNTLWCTLDAVCDNVDMLAVRNLEPLADLRTPETATGGDPQAPR
ncbi:hypothetical protein [Actinocorallia longicatena]|uniref:Uncharacterized protein n=1 Tax=Actinocorallia longicatena TaxID=111803 RepID=A0ABP6QL98_9ACTN